MSTWFYYDSNGQKQGPVSGGQLKGLAKAGLITPGTLVETEDGKTALAKKVNGLTFGTLPQPETIQPVVPNPVPIAPPQTTALSVPTTSLPATSPPIASLLVPLPSNDASLSTLQQGEAPVSAKRRTRRKWVLALVAFVALILAGYTLVPGVMRHIPLLNIVAPKSYQRGTGSYVVRYADRSYDRAQWKMVWSADNVGVDASLGIIGGWDANNLAVGNAERYAASPFDRFPGIVLRDGHWLVLDEEFRNPYFTGANTFYASGPRYIYRFDPSGYSMEEEMHGYAVTHQLDENYFQLCDRRSEVLYERVNGKFIQVRDDEKKRWIWRENNANTQHKVELKVFHSFRNGKALAYYPDEQFMIRYRDGLWYEHYETTHTGNVNCLWAINEDNFILVGHEGITRFREGKESHPTVNVSGWSFRGYWLAVWGVSMDKFWVIDSKGNVAQFDDGNVRGVVRGPQLDEGEVFRDTWVSPEGVVYAVTEKEVYRLD